MADGTKTQSSSWHRCVQDRGSGHEHTSDVASLRRRHPRRHLNRRRCRGYCCHVHLQYGKHMVETVQALFLSHVQRARRGGPPPRSHTAKTKTCLTRWSHSTPFYGETARLRGTSCTSAESSVYQHSLGRPRHRSFTRALTSCHAATHEQTCRGRRSRELNMIYFSALTPCSSRKPQAWQLVRWQNG